MNVRGFGDLLRSIDQARKIKRDTGGSPQRPILKPKEKKARHSEITSTKKNKGIDRVYPRGTMKISKDPNKGYSRSNPTGKDR